ncbi:5792_t:CDS:1, partial [Entrophospora sp. SA101]
KYLQLAAENGYEVALHFLGVYYFEGTHGYEKDHDQAIDYLKCVAFQNHNEQFSQNATNIINQINQSNQTNQTNQTNQINQINQTNQTNQTN